MPNNSVWLWKFILQLKNEPPLITVGAGNKACLVIHVWTSYHSICIWLCFDSRVDCSTSKDFYTRFYPLHYFLILILEKEPVFPLSMLSVNKGTTGTIFITYLVWRGPWLGIEPRTSRTRCQHSTTRLSRRRMSICFDYKHQLNYQQSNNVYNFMRYGHYECFRWI